MNPSTLSASKKAFLFFLCLLGLTNVIVLVYALVYASPGSVYRKNAMVIGLSFIVATWLIRYTYKTFLGKN